MLIAVCGASGRLGQSIVRILLAKKLPVVAIVRSKSSANRVPKGAKLRYVNYENEDLSVLRKNLEDVSHIINCTGSTDTSLGREGLVHANVDVTKKILKAAPKKLKRFVHISSISVYGKKFDGVCVESCPKHSDTPYAKSKLSAEREVLSYKKDFDVVILQPGMIYGPKFTYGFYDILQKISEGKMRIIGTGKNHIPLVHVEDVSSAVINCLSAKVKSGSQYILVTQPQLTQNELICIASDILGITSACAHTSYALAKFYYRLKEFYLGLFGKKPAITLDMIEQICSNRRFSGKKAAKDIGFKPSVSFKTGIEEVVNEFLKNGKR